MKISILGAGPSGLYFAILMKKVDPTHEIEIIERNPPDATFGWGVVFSEETLGALREADEESYIAITDTFAQWDAIDVHYRGTRVSSRGHRFSAISRKALLGLLQDRARELDVGLTFERELADLDPLADADLVVGADGVNSLVRGVYADELGAKVESHGTKFAWFGTDLVFDAFTFIFHETEHGLIQAHAYPFDGTTSTFIVECTEEVWERAGLGDMDEAASMEFCERLFANELEGHRLLSNRSLWTSFAHVNCESWHTGNVVLLGDAAHTAHFTIGSGTKLAMEDSLALADAFLRHEDIPGAIVDYELERQPVVERFQEVANESATYFENVRHYSDFDPVPFAFNLLTRSGRIGYANMTLRDAVFMRAVDGCFATPNGEGGSPRSVLAPPPMFTPLALGDATVANRVVVSPVVDEGALDGVPSNGRAQGFIGAARAGAGMLVTEPIAVAADARITPECPTLGGDTQSAAWRKVVDAAKDESSVLVCAQLNHAGRRGSMLPRRIGVDLPLRDGGWSLLSASALRYGPGCRVPAELDEAGMERIRGEFVTAAGQAIEAGFDALELNLAHGYLLASFLSPLSNRREDSYGGSVEQRLAFPLSVIKAVRGGWGTRPLSARISVVDWAPRGNRIEDGVEVATALGAECNLIHVDAGQTTAGARPEYRRSYLMAFADRIRSETGVNTLVGGYVTTSDEINTAIGAGRADLCLFDARALATGVGVR
jgi:anthraniloyl-CoA monooxygenase